VQADEATRLETGPASLRAAASRPRAGDVARELRRDDQGQLRPPGLGRAVLTPFYRRRENNAMIMGLVRVGKTFTATAVGHAAVRRRFSVVFWRTDVLLKKLRATASATAMTRRCESS
jgi:hypothetical protein